MRATIWNKPGDHPNVESFKKLSCSGGDDKCKKCGKIRDLHGALKKSEGLYDLICPGDSIDSGE